MMTCRKLILSLALAVLGLSGVEAAQDEGIEVVKKNLKLLFPGQVVGDVTPSPVEGLYEVVFGPQLFYVSGNGRYLIQGSVIDLESRQNLTEPRKAQARIEAINALGEDNMVVFAPKKVDHTITVFTDIDCAYCRKLHKEIDVYQNLGIKVRYLMYPRAGVGSPAYKKALSVWCSDDRNGALTRAKQGEVLKEAQCENPVQDHLMMGELVGIRGTPAIVSEQGELLPGYVPAKRLRQHLDSLTAAGS